MRRGAASSENRKQVGDYGHSRIYTELSGAAISNLTMSTSSWLTWDLHHSPNGNVQANWPPDTTLNSKDHFMRVSSYPFIDKQGGSSKAQTERPYFAPGSSRSSAPFRTPLPVFTASPAAFCTPSITAP